MCSTPRPKSAIKGKVRSSGTILSNCSAEARSRFAQRANAAQERREQVKAKEQVIQRKTARLKMNKRNTKPVHKPTGLSYWLFHASVKEILLTVFVGRSKHV